MEAIFPLFVVFIVKSTWGLYQNGVHRELPCHVESSSTRPSPTGFAISVSIVTNFHFTCQCAIKEAASVARTDHVRGIGAVASALAVAIAMAGQPSLDAQGFRTSSFYSSDFADIVRKMLRVDHKKRVSALDILNLSVPKVQSYIAEISAPNGQRIILC